MDFSKKKDDLSVKINNKWAGKKKSNLCLSVVYDEIDSKKAQRLRDCCSVLSFKVFDDHSRKLNRASFCRVRLCPICSWRRSLKVFAQMTRILGHFEALHTAARYRYLFLTMTVKNCSRGLLSDTMDEMIVGWKRFSQSKIFSSSVLGWYRGLEVTHNVVQASEHYDTYHPHFHCLLVVDSSYFSQGNYVGREVWRKQWQESMRLDYNPQVDIRCFKGNLFNSLREVTKYSVKAQDYIIPDDWDLTVDTVKVLDQALNKRRFVAFGGKLKEIHKKLNLDSEENGDLIHIAGDFSDDEKYRIVRYCFSSGYNEYREHH